MLLSEVEKDMQEIKLDSVKKTNKEKGNTGKGKLVVRKLQIGGMIFDRDNHVYHGTNVVLLNRKILLKLS